MTYANADLHTRTFTTVDSKSRKRCSCGCGKRATHIGLANGVAMMSGCEMKVRRWAKRYR